MANRPSEEKPEEERYLKLHQVQEEEDEVEDYNDDDELFFAGRGCCFRWCCLQRLRKDRRSVLGNEGNDDWWLLKKVREVSEIVAGPRWKTFIRKFNKAGKGKKGQFQYDPSSYALNFDGDGGERQQEKEEQYRYPNFSDRFATPRVGMNGVELVQDPAAFRL